MKFLNERGNLLLTISFLLIISAAVGGFVLNNKRVSEAVQTLDSLQVQNVIKGDLEKNIINILKGEATGCNNPQINAIKNQFANVNASGPNVFSKSFNFSTPYQSFNNIFVRCFLTPEKFKPGNPPQELRPSDLDIRIFKVEMRKTNTLNLSNVFIDVTADIVIGIKSKSSGLTSYKYNVKARVSPKSMNDYGLIFTNYNGNQSLFSSQVKTKVTVFGKTLVSANNSSNPNLSLEDFTSLDKAEVRFADKVELEGKKINVNNQFATLINSGEISIRNIFSNGVLFNPNLDSDIKKPWKTNYTSFVENYWYQFFHKAYILPELDGAKKAVNRQASTYFYYERDEDNNNLSSVNTKDTAEIFEAMQGYEKKDISKTCGPGKMTSGIFDTFAFNNLEEVLVIDLSQNNDEDNPPYFCGVVAAKAIRVKLNSSSSESFKKNYLIGKFIVKENIIIEGPSNKELVIIDSSNANSSQLVYPLPNASGGQTLENIGRQLFMQKFYQTQNFFVFMFKTEPSNPFFLPRTLKSFFEVDNITCGTTSNPLTDSTAWCRAQSIPTPELEEIRALNNNFYYEVSIID